MSMTPWIFRETDPKWRADHDYVKGHIKIGSDEAVYICLLPCGPKSEWGPQDPVHSPDYWKRLDHDTDLSAYLTKKQIHDTFLTKDEAAKLFQSLNGMSGYLTLEDAAGIYLSQTDAEDTYLSKTDAEDTYATIDKVKALDHRYLTELKAAQTYLTSAEIASMYALKSDLEDIDKILSGLTDSDGDNLSYLGTVADYDSLPESADTGATYKLEDTGDVYFWDGSEWTLLGEDLTDYLTKDEASATYATKEELESATSGTSDSSDSSALGDGTVGSDTSLIYVDSGTLTASTATVGDDTTPIYLSSGALTACGGKASIFASTSALDLEDSATPNEILAAMPTGSIFLYDASNLTADEWNFPDSLYHYVEMVKTSGATRAALWLHGKNSAHGDLRAFYDNDNGFNSPTWYTTMVASDSDVGASTTPIYISGGVATASTTTVGSGTKPVYLSSGKITASGSTVGSTSTPVYLKSGTLTACSLGDTYLTIDDAEDAYGTAYPTVSNVTTYTLSSGYYYIKAPSGGTWWAIGDYNADYNSSSDSSSTSTTYVNKTGISGGGNIVKTNDPDAINSVNIMCVQIA